jgi:stage V sporulation protein SpoVS
MSRSSAAHATEWLGSDRSPAAVAAALDRLAREANDAESRAAFKRGAVAIMQAATKIAAGRGRKPIGDEAALIEMARHNLKRRERGLCDNDREAAKVISHRFVGHSAAAVIDRLRRKLKKQRPRLMKLAAGT